VKVVQLFTAAGMALVLASCGGGDQREAQPSVSTTETTEQTTTVIPIPERVEGAAPTVEKLLGNWAQVGVRLLWRFNRDGTFAFDRANLEAPYARGTYELEGRILRFTARGPGCVDEWSWKTGISEEKDRLDDELHVAFLGEGCDVIAGTKWTFARISS
jgi:hypothetical protein